MIFALHRNDDSNFWASSTFSRLQVGFWISFLVLPIFTGLLSYHWLPNEYYDQRKHELLESHVEERGGRTGEVHDLWRDKQTGKLFSPADFTIHRQNESWRMAAVWFGYGLVGCFFFAFSRWIRNVGSFYRSFGMATLVNLAVAAYTWVSTA